MARADKLENLVRDLARRIAPMVQGDKAACVDWKNRGAISDVRSLSLRSLFVADLGIRQPSASPAAENCAIDFVLDRTPAQIVLAVKVGSVGEKRVFISEILRSDISASAVARSSAQLQKELLLQQSERILDALEIQGKNGEASRLLVLTRGAVSVFQPESGGLKLTSSQPVPSSNVIQRAPGGELRWNPDAPDTVEIMLPEQACRMKIAQFGALNCQPATASWRKEMLAGPPCAEGPWSLRTDSGDWSEADTILVVNPMLPKDQTPSAEIGLPGPVLSLAPGNLPGVFEAVVFNLSAGNYEVYRITMACGS